MSVVQTKIAFPARKRSTRLSVKVGEKENSSDFVPCKSAHEGERSPLKSIQKVSSPKRHSSVVSEASPPKLTCPETPTQIISELQIGSPGIKRDSSHQNDSRCTPIRKELFPQSGSLSAARRALHSSSSTFLPSREDKISEVRTILLDCLSQSKGKSLYISGPPGTGKTASLTSVVSMPEISKGFKTVYINCSALTSSKSIFCHICKELGLQTSVRSDKAYQKSILKHTKSAKKMMLLVLDEMDYLESKNQEILYTILSWASDCSRMVLIGVANSLDLTDRLLPRLAGRPDLKPTLLHFSPYTRQQIVDIISHRLSQASCCDIFEKAALHLLASKIASISGDIRKALDIARRVIDITETSNGSSKVSVSSVLEALNNVYNTAASLANSDEGCPDSFPLQQKLAISSLLLIKENTTTKDLTIGKLHDVYKKVCDKRNLTSLDISEFISIIQLIEDRGIVKLGKQKNNRLCKVILQWDLKEVSSTLKDKELLASVLDDVSCLTK